MQDVKNDRDLADVVESSVNEIPGNKLQVPLKPNCLCLSAFNGRPLNQVG